MEKLPSVIRPEGEVLFLTESGNIYLKFFSELRTTQTYRITIGNRREELTERFK